MAECRISLQSRCENRNKELKEKNTHLLYICYINMLYICLPPIVTFIAPPCCGDLATVPLHSRNFPEKQQLPRGEINGAFPGHGAD